METSNFSYFSLFFAGEKNEKTKYCRDRRMVAGDFARFMNGASKIHERSMNRKKNAAAIS